MPRAETVDVDYLVVGAGATGIAFADTLLAESDATLAIVDERATPGGHWNEAYRFVRLHQPSSFYGVDSTPLGRDAVEVAGPNEGLLELATGAQVCAYFEHVMQRVLLPSGRVRYLPRCRVEPDGRVVSLLDGSVRAIRVRRKTVDSTYTAGTIPARHRPTYEVARGVWHVPVGDLTDLPGTPEGYVVVGAGKTGIDCCLWLLDQGVDPRTIRWIVSQDSWLLDRARIQPSGRYFDATVGNFAEVLESAAAATSVPDLFARLEAIGSLLRIDPDVTPTAYRCATVSRPELEQLRRLPNVVRQGRVRAIERRRILLERGDIPTHERIVHVDCSAKGLAPKPLRPVFDGERMTLQMVRVCQPTFSAALIGWVEAHRDDDAVKNELCRPVPGPDLAIDWLRTRLADSANNARWSREPDLMAWLARTRLNLFNAVLQPELPAERAALRARVLEAMPAAMENLQRLLAQAGN